VELFVNGLLPKPVWMFLSSAIMIPFHKIAQMERLLLSDMSLRPITIGAMLTRISVQTVLRMHRKGIAENMLKSNQISYGVSSGVQPAILGCTVALQSNPTWVLGVFDLRNAHTDCSRGLIWHELENDTFFHFLIHIFICMYGENRTPQGHFGNGPDQPPTSIHWSGDDLRQEKTSANVYSSTS
jgi:hypothetical protein